MGHMLKYQKYKKPLHGTYVKISEILKKKPYMGHIIKISEI